MDNKKPVEKAPLATSITGSDIVKVKTSDEKMSLIIGSVPLTALLCVGSFVMGCIAASRLSMLKK